MERGCEIGTRVSGQLSSVCVKLSPLDLRCGSFSVMQIGIGPRARRPHVAPSARVHPVCTHGFRGPRAWTRSLNDGTWGIPVLDLVGAQGSALSAGIGPGLQQKDERMTPDLVSVSANKHSDLFPPYDQVLNAIRQHSDVVYRNGCRKNTSHRPNE